MSTRTMLKSSRRDRLQASLRKCGQQTRRQVAQTWSDRDLRFGDPAWFRSHRRGWGLEPVTRSGWIYCTAWLIAGTLPTILLLGRGQVPEALLWFAVASTLLCRDVRLVNRASGSSAAKSEKSA